MEVKIVCPIVTFYSKKMTADKRFVQKKAITKNCLLYNFQIDKDNLMSCLSGFKKNIISYFDPCLKKHELIVN